jgi:hypothetical protein
MARQDPQQLALELANGLVGVTQHIVGTGVVAQVLHGSLASGDFAPNKSDVDLLVIVREPLDDAQKSRLGDAVTVLAQRRGVWLDYRVVTSHTALHAQPAPMLDFSVGIHAGVAARVEIVRGPVAEPDLLYEFAICREEGRSLVGAAPAQVIGPVRNDWLLDLGDAYLKRWQEIEYDERDAELMVFTACRLWYRYTGGGHLTKSDAAKWVLRQAPELVAPRTALERRTAGTEAEISEADVMTLLATVHALLALRT